MPNMCRSRPRIILDPVPTAAEVDRVATTEQIAIRLGLQSDISCYDVRYVSADYAKLSPRD